MDDKTNFLTIDSGLIQAKTNSSLTFTTAELCVMLGYSRFPVGCPIKTTKHHVSKITMRMYECSIGANLNDPALTLSSMDNTAASALVNQLQKELFSQVLKKYPGQKKTQSRLAILSGVSQQPNCMQACTSIYVSLPSI